jgi:F420-dependent oxidoreductase-like protein
VPDVTDDLKLGLQLGYWTAQPPAGRELIELAQKVEALGFDSIWTGESWSSDAFSPLVWVAAHTSRIKLATGIAQMSARSPVTMAMHAMTLDALSDGRFRLGIGVSGPQVVEGWYGRPFGQPLARTREYIDILRQVWRREEPVTNAGPHYPLPYDGPGAVGLGKPLKMITHPPRPDIPVYLGAEGPKNVRLATEIADGWIPLYYSPTRPEVYADQLADTPEGFEIAVNVTVTVADDVAQALLPVKGMLGFYIGGMGAKGRNFHTDLMARMGFEEEAHRIQDLFFAGKREEAVLAVPDEFADEISLVGPPARIRERIEAWRKTPVTTLLIGSRDPEALRLLADVTR